MREIALDLSQSVELYVAAELRENEQIFAPTAEAENRWSLLAAAYGMYVHTHIKYIRRTPEILHGSTFKALKPK